MLDLFFILREVNCSYMQGCHKVRKSQEKLRKMTQVVRKSQVKMGVFEKSNEKSRNFTKF